MSSTEAKKETTPAQQAGAPGGENVPSGFILKLFQMVNGAPDEVIRWTSEGDAFVIGSDLERLESETLPQYFRHNRFQSLVRQLNFYSFRKINRERNVWIYKHNLFHRDRTEDLYMVRRRTCPGLDGRKQRFSSRAGTGKGSNKNKDEGSDGEFIPTMLDAQQQQVIEESSSNDTSAPGDRSKKRRDSMSSRTSEVSSLDAEQKPKPKRPRYEPPAAAPDSPVVDFSILRAVVEANSSLLQEGEDDSSLHNKRNEKLEMLEQSMVVSDVAMKLEEYAKRARKNGFVTARRSGAGVVTPPFGSSSLPATMSASELLTYDDEYDSSDKDLRVTDLFGIHSASSVVTDTDLEEAEEERFEVTQLPEELLAAPVQIPQAKSITERLLQTDVAAGAVAGFCMTNAPNGNPDLSRKILQLIASCEALADDFHQYRSALKPEIHSGEQQLNTGSPFHHVRMNHVQNWEREGSRSDAVRDFKVFSVNQVRKILAKHGRPSSGLPGDDRAALERTADVWLKSVGMADQQTNNQPQ